MTQSALTAKHPTSNSTDTQIYVWFFYFVIHSFWSLFQFFFLPFSNPQPLHDTRISLASRKCEIMLSTTRTHTTVLVWGHLLISALKSIISSFMKQRSRTLCHHGEGREISQERLNKYESTFEENENHSLIRQWSRRNRDREKCANLVYTNTGNRAAAAAPTCCVLKWRPGSCGWSSPATAGPSQAQRAGACWGNLAPWAGRPCSGRWGRGSVLQVLAGRAPGRAWDCWRSFPNCWS